MINRTVMARFIWSSVGSLLPACSAAGCRAGGRRAGDAAGGQHGDTQVLKRRLLLPLELDERFAVVENRAQFAVPRVRQIALRLHDEVVRRHADLELALLGF